MNLDDFIRRVLKEEAAKTALTPEQKTAIVEKSKSIRKKGFHNGN